MLTKLNTKNIVYKIVLLIYNYLNIYFFNKFFYIDFLACKRNILANSFKIRKYILIFYVFETIQTLKIVKIISNFITLD